MIAVIPTAALILICMLCVQGFHLQNVLLGPHSAALIMTGTHCMCTHDMHAMACNACGSGVSRSCVGPWWMVTTAWHDLYMACTSLSVVVAAVWPAEM